MTGIEMQVRTGGSKLIPLLPSRSILGVGTIGWPYSSIEMRVLRQPV
jgi:hypothetical protein